jgi:hypothetical protein
MQSIHLTFLGAIIAGSLSAGSGCTARTQVHGHAYVETTPTLVAVGPGLWVVEDHDASVFYNDGYYWRNIDGVWYRSSIHTGAWVRVNRRVIPRTIVRVDRPHAYRHYHARPGVRVKHGPKARPVVRDHRDTRRSERDRRDKTRERDHRKKHHR